MLADTFTLSPDGVQIYECVPVDIFYLLALCWPLIGLIKASRQKIVAAGLRFLKWVYLDIPVSKNICTYLVKLKSQSI